MGAKLRKPCDNCPWRKDAPRFHWDPQHFIDIWNRCQGDSLNLMLCHKSSELPADAPDLICQGWVRVLGFEAIGVRIAAMRGLVSLAEIADRRVPELFKSFVEMLRENRIPIPPLPVYRPPTRRSRDATQEPARRVRKPRS